MPLRKAKSPKERDGEGSKSVRRTKEPFKTSRLNDVEQMPGVPVTQHQHSYGAGLHGSFGDLLDRFPDPPGPPPRPIRNPLRATSLNNASHVTNATPSRPTAVRYPSLLDQPRGRQHRKFAIHQAIPIPDSNHETNIVVPENVVLGSVIPRRAARVRAQTEAHSYGSDPFQVHHLASHTGSGRGSGLHSRDATIAHAWTLESVNAPVDGSLNLLWPPLLTKTAPTICVRCASTCRILNAPRWGLTIMLSWPPGPGAPWMRGTTDNITGY